MTAALRHDLAKRLIARSKYIFGWGIGVRVEEDGRFILTAYNPRNKKDTVEEEVGIDMDEYARVYSDLDDRDIFIDTVIRGFLYPVKRLEPDPDE